MREGNRVSGWEERLIDDLIALVSRLGEKPDQQRGERPKFVGYDDLLKLLEKPECPVCTIVRRSIQSFLGVAFVEQLTVPEFREPLRASFGYCNAHSVYVRGFARNRLRAMGVAIVYEDILAYVQDFMQKEKVVPAVSGCPLCRLHQEIESYAIHLIADYCNDEEFQDRYESSTGVCLPHLHAILGLLIGDERKFIMKSHVMKLETQLRNVQGFIRKHDYRFTHEKMTEAEATSWKDAIRFVAGN
jgi:hypothetical protein